MDTNTAIESFNSFTAREGIFAGMFIVTMIFAGYFIWKFGNKLFDMLEKYLTATAAADLKTSAAVEALAACVPQHQAKMKHIDDRLTVLLKAMRAAAYVAKEMVPESDRHMRDKLDQVIKDLE